MAQTLSTALSAAITFKTQAKVLDNLRNELVFANSEWAEQGEFDAGTDTILFLSFPDMSATTPSTPIAEGVVPTRRALTMGTIAVDTDQYADLLAITDLAKVKSPVQIVSIGAERLTRVSKVVLDGISRDVIAAGGTPYFAASGNLVRSDISATEIASVADLRRMKWSMYKANIPEKPDGYYHLLVSPEVAADLSADADFIDAVKYTDRMPLLKNEIGSIAGFRVISVVNAPTFASTTTVHASIAVGGIKAWGAGELQSFKTYHIPPGGDHLDPVAQEELLGWKVMFGVAVLDNSYYYRYESAASSLAP